MVHQISELPDAKARFGVNRCSSYQHIAEGRFSQSISPGSSPPWAWTETLAPCARLSDKSRAAVRLQRASGMRYKQRSARHGSTQAPGSKGNQGATFTLPIDNDWRLSADDRCWRLEQRRKDGEWRALEWHASIESAVNALARRCVRTSQVRSLAEALKAVERVTRELTRALAPAYHVEAKRE